jgi:hypothetical protein
MPGGEQEKASQRTAVVDENSTGTRVASPSPPGRAQPVRHSSSRTEQVRAGGYLGIGASVVGITVALVDEFTRPVVPLTATSYPLAAAPFAWFEVLLVLFHVAVLGLVLALAISGGVGRRRSARIGLGAALIGCLLQIVAEAGYIFAGNTTVDDVLPVTLSMVFLVSSLLLGLGMMLAGFGALRTGNWRGWRLYAPVAVGVATVVLTVLIFNDVTRNWGLLVWALSIGALGYALASRPTVVTRSRAAARGAH